MGRERILIVEDEPNTAEMLRIYFESLGYEVETAGTGTQAVEVAKQTVPDLVLLDIRLPDIDGYEVCRRLRGQRRTAHIPVVFLTERRERLDKLAGLELGAVDYITKPFDVQELRLRVRNILRRGDRQPVTHPVTGLPYATLVDERLSEMMSESRWAVVAVALEGLEGFGDRYGFVARDDVLRAAALIVQRAVSEGQASSAFVGQLDDTCFIAIAEPDDAERIRQQLRARLGEAVAFFYPHADWEAAQRGSGVTFPHLLVRTGVVTSGVKVQDVRRLRHLIRASLSAT